MTLGDVFSPFGGSRITKLLESTLFWQSTTFILLLCFVWVNEVLDLPNLLFSYPASEVDLTRGCVLTAGVILIGFISVAHTHLRQRRMLEEFVVVCAHCRKVKLDESAWEELESYVQSRTQTSFSHGICPSCFSRTIHEARSAGLLTTDQPRIEKPGEKPEPEREPAMTK